MQTRRQLKKNQEYSIEDIELFGDKILKPHIK